MHIGLLFTAKILIQKERLNEAYDVFLKLKKLFPVMPSVQGELTALTAAMTENSIREKHLYRRMIGLALDMDIPKHNIPNIRKIEDKRMNQKILWGLVGGASAIILTMFVHKFIL